MKPEIRGNHWVLRLNDAKRTRVKLGPATMASAEAERKARAVAAAVRGREVKKAEAVQRETFDLWAERWLQDRESVRGVHAVRQDRARWGKHCRDLHPLFVDEIKREHLEDLVSSLDSKVRSGDLAWKTARNVWAVVSRMCRDMFRSKSRALRVRADNPAADVEPPDGGARAARVYLYPSEVDRLLSCTRIDPRWRVLYALLAYTGLRAGELDALTWGDVEGGVIRVFRASVRDGATKVEKPVKATKTGVTRTVPVEAALVPLLEALRGNPSERVCRVPMWQAPQLREHLRWAGVDRSSLFARGPGQRPITLHDLRATCITWQALRGDAPLIIQRRAGHTTFSTTQLYLREAEALAGVNVGVPFQPLPEALLGVVGALDHDMDQRTTGDEIEAETGCEDGVPRGIRSLVSALIPDTCESGGPSSIRDDTRSQRPDAELVRKALRHLNPALRAAAGVALRKAGGGEE